MFIPISWRSKLRFIKVQLHAWSLSPSVTGGARLYTKACLTPKIHAHAH